MANEFIIKEDTGSVVTFSGGKTAAATITNYTNANVANGELLSVEWTASTIGSLYVQMSGTAIEVFRRNAPSGAGWQLGIPRAFGQLTTGSVTASSTVPFYFTEPLTVNLAIGSNAVANISGLSYQVRLKYR